MASIEPNRRNGCKALHTTRTATVCAAPVAAREHPHYAAKPFPGPRRVLPCCGWSSADTAALPGLTDRDCVRSTSRYARTSSLRRGTIPQPSPCLTVLRLVLGGHSRAPRPYGPRLCAKHQSLRANILTTPWNYPPAFAVSYRAAAGPRRTQSRSPALRTATVCKAPVAAREHPHYAVELSPGLRRVLPCCGWSSTDTAALHSPTDRDCVQSTSRCARTSSLRRGTIPRPSPCLTVLRLVLDGHSRAPQACGPPLPTGPRRAPRFRLLCKPRRRFGGTPSTSTPFPWSAPPRR
jgi:hypothetical protein